jgi:hypothetical protein
MADVIANHLPVLSNRGWNHDDNIEGPLHGKGFVADIKATLVLLVGVILFSSWSIGDFAFLK